MGDAPVSIPMSPHLADLHPTDVSQMFSYESLVINLWIAGGDAWSANTGGTVTLYGSEKSTKGIGILKPGEWIRVRGKGRITMPGDGLDILQQIRAGHSVDRMYAETSLYRVNGAVIEGTETTATREICLPHAPGQSLTARVEDPN